MIRSRLLVAALALVGLSFASTAFADDLVRLTEVPFTRVTIEDRLFAPRRDVNRRVSLAHSLDMLEKAGNLRNLERAARGERTGYEGPVFMDSDLYKVVEAVAYSLATDPDPALDQRLDAVIATIAAAQRPDGYVNSWYQVNAPERRFTNLRDDHELYCAGHMFEAAAAHFRATGKRSLLDVATKYADLLCATFGAGDGKRPGYCGHPEIELALIKLADVTGETKYVDLARHFIDTRGSKFFAVEHGEPLEHYDGGYCQDQVPLRELNGVVGHAVRFGYLLSGATDVVAHTGDRDLARMLKRVWKNTAEKNTFLTGGIGPSGSNEGFTEDYDLPTLTAYQETCATIALAQWSHRMNLLFGEAKYADAVEIALMNGVLAGVSQDGKRFFYVNPLESRGDHHRPEWFSCACCPPNVARTLSALGNYVYAVGNDGVRVNLYVQGKATIERGPRMLGSLEVTTEYPLDGWVKIKTTSALDTPLHLRIPAWCSEARIQVNDVEVEAPIERGYAVLRRSFAAGDVIELELSLNVRRVEAHPESKALRGLSAFMVGPLVYAFEQCDQSEPLSDVFIPFEAPFSVARSDLFDGINVLVGDARVAKSPPWRRGLYRTLDVPRPAKLVAIPYAFWDNREPGAMKVWMPATPAPPRANALEADAKVEVSFKNWNSQPDGIRDGLEPAASDEQPAALCHWWNHEGGTEWVAYTWDAPVALSGVKVYWFDDTGRGACRVPKAWRLLARNGDAWVPVAGATAFPIAKDRWCDVKFPALTTRALKLEVDMQDGFAAGIHEWKVIEAETEDA
ncbi:MAG: glycoside hydrolase family 127 protein [Planctomycetes bacterium]|nr:glycoside hydrolase family 127 protein [Planctomycetota bacterium]